MASERPTSVRIERYFNASPRMVWRGWTEESLVRRWFGSDPEGRVLDARLDVRVGGSFEVTFQDSNGTEHTCGGDYVEIGVDSRLGFSWRWRSEPGVETFITVQLDAEGPGTRMTFEHSRLFDASVHDYESGWGRTFDKLARVLKSPA